MRKLLAVLTTVLDLAAVGFAVAAAAVGLGLWAALAAGGLGCVGLSWALSKR